MGAADQIGDRVYLVRSAQGLLSTRNRIPMTIAREGIG